MPAKKPTAFALKIRGYHGNGLRLPGSRLTGIEASLHVPLKKGYCVDGFKWLAAIDAKGDEMFILTVDATIKGGRYDLQLLLDRSLLMKALRSEQEAERASKYVFMREGDRQAVPFTKGQIKKIATAVGTVFNELTRLGFEMA